MDGEESVRPDVARQTGFLVHYCTKDYIGAFEAMKAEGGFS